MLNPLYQARCADLHASYYTVIFEKEIKVQIVFSWVSFDSSSVHLDEYLLAVLILSFLLRVYIYIWICGPAICVMIVQTLAFPCPKGKK